MFESILRTVEQEISGAGALEHLIQINRTDRWFSFDKFQETAAYCAAALRAVGARDVEVLPLCADGRTPNGDWVIPQAWDARDAELRVASPASAAGRIVRYRDVPQSLVMYSAPTPPEGVEAGLVVADDRAELARADARGRIVLTSSRPRALLDLAAEKGALGIVSDCLPPLAHTRDRFDLPDAVRWENDCFVPTNVARLFAFSISPRSGEQLRALVKREASEGREVRLFARVDARLYDGTVPVVSGLIPGEGSDGEEVVICTHLYEPGANDNASGCAISLEIARCFGSLIARGDLPRPKRGIRFILGWECAGFTGYVAHHRDRIPKMVAGLDVDMAGGNQDRNRAYLHLYQNPHSSASYTDLLMRRIVERYQAERNPWLRWGEEGYGIGDQLFADPMIGVPTPGLLQHPDMTWHTSLDTVERIDPRSLQQVAAIAATYLWFVANAGSAEASWLAVGQAGEAAGKLGWLAERFVADAARQASASPEAAREAWARFRRDVAYQTDRELAAIGSLRRLVAGAASSDREVLEQDLQAVSADVKAAGQAAIRRAERALAGRLGAALPEEMAEPALTPVELEAAGIVPVRTVLGSLTLHPLLSERIDRYRWDPFYNYTLNCPIYWADGRRSLLEIARLVECELGRADLRSLLDYVRFLAEHGYLEVLNTA